MKEHIFQIKCFRKHLRAILGYEDEFRIVELNKPHSLLASVLSATILHESATY